MAPYEQKPALVNVDVVGLTLVRPHGRILRKHNVIMAHGIMDPMPNQYTEVLITNFSNARRYFPRNTIVGRALARPTIVSCLTSKGSLAKPSEESAPHKRTEDPVRSIYSGHPPRSDKFDKFERNLKIESKFQCEISRTKQAQLNLKRLNLEHLPKCIARKIESLLLKYPSLIDGSLGTLKGTDHRIDLVPGS